MHQSVSKYFVTSSPCVWHSCLRHVIVMNKFQSVNDVHVSIRARPNVKCNGYTVVLCCQCRWFQPSLHQFCRHLSCVCCVKVFESRADTVPELLYRCQNDTLHLRHDILYRHEQLTHLTHSAPTCRNSFCYVMLILFRQKEKNIEVTHFMH